jgi:hypothetical protein
MKSPDGRDPRPAPRPRVELLEGKCLLSLAGPFPGRDLPLPVVELRTEEGPLIGGPSVAPRGGGWDASGLVMPADSFAPRGYDAFAPGTPPGVAVGPAWMPDARGGDPRLGGGPITLGDHHFRDEASMGPWGEARSLSAPADSYARVYVASVTWMPAPAVQTDGVAMMADARAPDIGAAGMGSVPVAPNYLPAGGPVVRSDLVFRDGPPVAPHPDARVSAGPDGPAPSAGVGPILPVTVVAPAGSGAVAGDPSRGVARPGAAGGLVAGRELPGGIAGVPDRAPLIIGADGRSSSSRGTPGPEGRPAPVAPLGPSRSPDGGEEPGPPPVIDVPGATRSGVADNRVISATQAADLLTHFLPFERSSLESAIDRFLGQFDGLGVDAIDGTGPLGSVPAPLAVAATALATEVALRLRRPREDEAQAPGADGEAGPVRFPGLPGPWGLDA